MHSRAWSQRQSPKVATKTSGAEGRPLVLFVCVHNAGRSRMAEAIFNSLAGDRYRALSAGTMPTERPHPEVVAAMAEMNLAVEQGPGRLLTQEMADDAAQVIGMGCAVEEACPALRTPLEDWGIEDPRGRSPEEVATIRDLIEMRVRNLVARLDRELQA